MSPYHAVLAHWLKKTPLLPAFSLATQELLMGYLPNTWSISQPISPWQALTVPHHGTVAGLYYHAKGNAYHRKGDYDKAIEYDIQALDMYKAVYGPDANHPDIQAVKRMLNIGMHQKSC